jgi:hypothetical protein
LLERADRLAKKWNIGIDAAVALIEQRSPNPPLMEEESENPALMEIEE